MLACPTTLIPSSLSRTKSSPRSTVTCSPTASSARACSAIQSGVATFGGVLPTVLAKLVDSASASPWAKPFSNSGSRVSRFKLGRSSGTVPRNWADVHASNPNASPQSSPYAKPSLPCRKSNRKLGTRATATRRANDAHALRKIAGVNLPLSPKPRINVRGELAGNASTTCPASAFHSGRFRASRTSGRSVTAGASLA